MINTRAARIAKFAVFGVVAVAVFGLIVMGLWNWLAPALFGLTRIGFWQAIGLVILCRILFGGFRGEGRGPRAERRGRLQLIERWEKMTPEERERFREGLRRGCGPFARQEARPPAETA